MAWGTTSPGPGDPFAVFAQLSGYEHGRGRNTKPPKLFPSKKAAPLHAPRNTPVVADTNNPYAGLFTGSAMDQAQKIADYLLGPYKDQYNQANRERHSLDTFRLKQLQDYIAGIAAQFQGVAPEVLAAYRAASGDQSQIAQGFSGDIRDAVQASADRDNALLSEIGAPSGQMIPGQQATDVGDVTYGLGGWIPATLMSQLGARAFADAAKIPATISARGLSAVSDLVGSQQEADAAAQAAYDQVLAQRPGNVLDLYGQIKDRQAAAQTAKAKAAADRQKARLDVIEAAQRQADHLSDATGYLYIVSPKGQVKRATDRRGRPIATLDREKAAAADEVARARVNATIAGAKVKAATAVERAAQDRADALTDATGILHIVDKQGRVKRATGRDGRPIQTLAGQRAARDELGDLQDRADELTQQTGFLYHVTADGSVRMATDKDGKPIPTLSREKAAQSADAATLRLAQSRADSMSDATGLVYVPTAEGGIKLAKGADGKPIQTLAGQRTASAADARVLQAAENRADDLTRATGILYLPTPDGGVAVAKDANGKPIQTLAGKKAAKGGDASLQHFTVRGHQLVFDPNTGIYTDPATGKPVDPNSLTGAAANKPVSPKVLGKGRQAIQTAKKGWWAARGNPDQPLTTSEINTILKDAYDNGDGITKSDGSPFTLADLPHLDQGQKNRLGLGYYYADPTETYNALINYGIPARRAWQMVRSQLKNWPNANPGWGVGWFRPKGGAAAQAADWGEYVYLRKGADRAGVTTDPAVLQFVGTLGARVGQRLQVSTGSNHNQYVAGSSRQSQHWIGHAADIPATGKRLTMLGRQALILAGADPAWANKQTGGAYTINGVNILFNTRIGGNHYNHLHVGLGESAMDAETGNYPTTGKDQYQATPKDARAARTPDGARAVGQKLAANYGWTGDEWAALNDLWTLESGWKYRISNQRGSGAVGIPQYYPAAHGPPPGDYLTNPVTQILWGLNYVRITYGTPSRALAFWHATVSKDPSLAPPDLQYKARRWIELGYTGY